MAAVVECESGNSISIMLSIVKCLTATQAELHFRPARQRQAELPEVSPDMKQLPHLKMVGIESTL